MIEDYEPPMEPNGYQSTSGFPENVYDEPDDSDQVYCDTWQEAEATASRMQQNARSWQSLTTPAATTKPTAHKENYGKVRINSGAGSGVS